MTAVWFGLAVGVAFLLGAVMGVRRSCTRCMDKGRRLTEIEHGYRPALTPGTHKAGRRKRWSWLNVKRPEAPADPQPRSVGYYR